MIFKNNIFIFYLYRVPGTCTVLPGSTCMLHVTGYNSYFILALLIRLLTNTVQKTKTKTKQILQGEPPRPTAYSSLQYIPYVCTHTYSVCTCHVCVHTVFVNTRYCTQILTLLVRRSRLSSHWLSAPSKSNSAPVY